MIQTEVNNNLYQLVHFEVNYNQNNNFRQQRSSSVRAPNSNCKIASLMPTLGLTRSRVLGKDTLRLYFQNEAN